MESFTAKIESSGRILIPAAVRARLDLKTGVEMVVRIDERGLCLLGTRQQALNRIQRRLRRFVGAGRRLSDELIAERRREAAREGAE